MAMSALGKTFLLCFICVLAKTVSARIGFLADPATSPTPTPYNYYATDPPASGSSGYGSSYGSSGSSGCFSGSETVTVLAKTQMKQRRKVFPSADMAIVGVKGCPWKVRLLEVGRKQC